MALSWTSGTTAATSECADEVRPLRSDESYATLPLPRWSSPALQALPEVLTAGQRFIVEGLQVTSTVPSERRAAVAADRIGVFDGRVIVVADRRMSMPVAIIKIGIAELHAAGTFVSVDSEPVADIAHQS
jgi:hypothetical protein